MSRSSSVFSDVNGESDAKRVFKSISNIVRYLDQEKDAARTYLDLFSKKIEIQRAKLCTYVERIMFIAPVEYGKKCEDILWKKAYYDIYTTMKVLKKDAPWTVDEISYLQNVLNRGIGNYHHLITRLQHEYKLQLDDVIDFPLNFLNFGMQKLSDYKKINSSYYNGSWQTESGEKWAERCVYHSLLYIGDLNRYMLDLYPGSDTKTAIQYYWKAFHLSPTNGMPHNQLATLANYYNDILDAVYHYMRCLCSVKPFYGASGNVTAIIDQNHPSRYETNIISIGLTPYKRVLLQFLHLIDIWYFNNLDDSSKLCAEFLENLDTWMALNTDKVSIRGNVTNLTELFLHKDEKPIERSVNDDSLFKIIVVCFVCHWKYYKKNSNGKLHNLETLILKLICRPIEYLVRKLKNVLPVPKDMSRSGSNESLYRRRHKRRIRGEKNNGSIFDESDDNVGFSTDDSDEELVFDENDSEIGIGSVQNGHGTNGFTNGFHKKCKPKDGDILQYTCKEYVHMIQAIKISFDWLRCNPKLWSCNMFEGQLENVVIMFNYLRNLNSKSNQGELQNENELKCALVEDFKLREFLPLKLTQESETWDFETACNLSSEKQMEIRGKKIGEFGKLLAKSLPNMMEYDEKSDWFTAKEVECETKSTNGLDKSKLMTKLWLQSEVKNLECKMEETAKANSLPPYLLLDCKALTQHCILIKKLVHSRKFIILVPSVVVSALDELKRTSGGARDAVRWLEGQFRQGNRYIRAQRANEKLTIPDVTYPKKKDKDAWLLIQIFEFCHYLNSINKNTTKEGSDTVRDECNFVRLLTGSKEMINEMASCKNGGTNNSIASIAESSGIIVEHVMDFYDNWKRTNKSYG